MQAVEYQRLIAQGWTPPPGLMIYVDPKTPYPEALAWRQTVETEIMCLQEAVSALQRTHTRIVQAIEGP